MSNDNKYYREVAVYMRPDKTCSVEAYLDMLKDNSDSKKGNKPLMIHEGWSRFVLTLIHKKNGAKEILKGNIPVSDVEYIQTMVNTHMILKEAFSWTKKIAPIFEASKKALMKLRIIKSPDTDTSSDLPACYTSKFKFGAGVKNKTPAELCLESAETRKLLAAQRDILVKNLPQYPANRPQLEAINEAIKLYNEKKLDPTLVEEAKARDKNFFEATIYEKPFKYIETDKKPDGRCFVYSIGLYCDYTKDEYQWRWNVKNCYAFVTKQPNGQPFIDVENGKDKQMLDFYLSDEEMVQCIHNIHKTLEYFELWAFRYQYSKVQTLNEFFYRPTDNGGNNNT